MTHRNMFLLMSLMLGVGYSHVGLADFVKEMSKEKEFYKKIERAPFSIGMFYFEDKMDCNWQRNIARQKRDFRLASRSRIYHDGNMRFLGLDLSKRGLEGLDDEFEVDIMPAFVLFKHGKPLRDANKKVIKLVGFVEDTAIKKFINRHLRPAIENYIEKEAERKAQERALNAAYFYGGWPYYGGYNGGCAGFGVGVGF
ncbi:MAG: hypothetical protein NTX86_01780 [Candidatus Dependentiae bacterium]|nr:hypothetical protein [Candidatus Dependentiae bacterium]